MLLVIPARARPIHVHDPRALPRPRRWRMGRARDRPRALHTERRQGQAQLQRDIRVLLRAQS